MKARVKQEGKMVWLVFEGERARAIDMPWEVAEKLGRILISAARKAEEFEKANQIITADALLIRTGAPFALSSNSKIREESFKQAQWDSKIRKGMPLLGVPSKKQLGPPSILKSKPGVRR